ncbi:GTP 3',8-cyclase MoaA [Cyanobium sp. N5-Cardenillas]|uniref:GTP 3',8-cyclase MoaA n=1 Tax=Cyanobium sp. N5-Cardenillas TaxID=2823720 RepID=UPI0020CE1640|nr:radical SAM protein [Cyanobium sp. N5-Cardenillas]MCP9784915.1 radical SAM protein [Cyanobium sp. N5-Cardenillas]
MAERPLDLHGRPLGVLRLSLTARCNLACPYCCPDLEDPPDLLTLPERVALVETTVGLGVHTLRLTGGEPLLHRQLEALIAALQPLRRRDPNDPRGALREIALTSNGVLLSADRARQLKAAGLDRITLSLDGTDGASVARMAGLAGAAAGGVALEKVLAGIQHAREAGFDPARGALKLNAVITRSGNADQLLPLAELARQQGLELRLIEFMDVGNRNGWLPEQVLPAAEMVARIGAAWPLEPEGRAPHGTAGRWRYRDRDGLHLAVVASITAPFCGDCNRLRITADGVAYSCLFAADGTDLKPWLRPRPDPARLRQALEGLWRARRDRWSEERQEAAERRPASAEMAYLGG